MSKHPDAVAAITQRYQEWMKAIRDRDLETILSIYADDATYMPPGRPMATGSAKLREVWGGYLQRKNFVAEYTAMSTPCSKGRNR